MPAEVQVLVTRPREQAGPLSELFVRAGMKPVCIPALEIVPQVQSHGKGTEPQGGKGYDWIIFISVNAVRHGLPAVGDLHGPQRPRIAAVGAATARALQEAGLNADLVPAEGASSEALLRTSALQEVRGARIRIVRGAGGRETLAQTLRARGASVDYLECYRRVPCAASAPLLQGVLAAPEAALLVSATSADILEALIELAGPQRDRLRRLPLAVMAPRIARAALRSGWRGPIVAAKTPSDEALVAAARRLRPCV